MFFTKFDENLTVKENRYDVAKGAANGYVRFSLFSNCNCFFLKADFLNQSYFL